jgi:plastocyanin
MKTPVLAAAVLAGALTAAAPAAAQVDYPAPAHPGHHSAAPKGPFKTLRVAKRKSSRYKTIQAVVNAAGPGDTVKVAHGTYHESVSLRGAAKRHVKLIGDPAHPEKVVLEGRGLNGAAAQNGVLVNGANEVTIRGITATHYKGNGFFLVNVDGYTLANLRAMQTGVYGLYAFNSIGGVMRDSEAAWNNDGGLYIGQTPPQTKPKRTLVTGIKAYGNVMGFSGTNMRYVTITKSQWFNNGAGIIPNALDSEKFAPPEENVITDNDIFWNNFNYYAGAPFKIGQSATTVPYPVGIGILLFGGRRNTIENNRVYGNYLVGIGAIQQFLLQQKDAQDLIGNTVRNNQMGLGGADPNGRDLFYDGNGSSNCFSDNEGAKVLFPADGSTFEACPFSGANAFNAEVQQQAASWAIDPDHEKDWIRGPHVPKQGIEPLERYTTMKQPARAPRAGQIRAAAAAARTKTVAVGDYFYAPTKLSVKRGTTIKWRWPAGGGDSHDVELQQGPKGVAPFYSDIAAGGYSYKRKLTRPGTYTFGCSLHEDMAMQVRVR